MIRSRETVPARARRLSRRTCAVGVRQCRSGLGFLQGGWGLQSVRDAGQEPGRGGAVYGAVVDGQAEGHRLAPGDAAVGWGRLVGDPADAQDRDFGWIDDRREGVDAEAAQVADGEGAALQFRYGGPAGPDALGERLAAGGQGGQGEGGGGP